MNPQNNNIVDSNLNQAASPGVATLQVKSDVSGIGWKEITLTRQEFDMLSDRLNKPQVEVRYVKEEFDRKFGAIFPLFFLMFYTILVFKDDWGVPDNAVKLLKFLLFILAVYCISNDNSLKNMGVNATSQMIIAICFATLLVASSSVV